MDGKVVDYPQEVILAEIVEIPSEENTQITTNKDIANENNTTNNIQRQNKLSKKNKALLFVAFLIVCLFFIIRGCNGYNNKTKELDTTSQNIIDSLAFIDSLRRVKEIDSLRRVKENVHSNKNSIPSKDEVINVNPNNDVRQKKSKKDLSNNQDRYSCNICGSNVWFITKESLDLHKKMHNVER